MPGMYRVLAFWTAIIAIMSMVGGFVQMSGLFFAQAGIFFALSFLNLSEKMYVYIFGAYLTLFFIGFTYWTHFMMVPGMTE
ncbi:DUF2626 family protein [Massilibacterium senegalense]|uniref:DUF2626 family protein n=1 Tax=Massilibacterium senegalense TaxID=1632858 RepID=UPI0007843005|nr:DUF2626 family protein [Massilibacterium senegalense]